MLGINLPDKTTKKGFYLTLSALFAIAILGTFNFYIAPIWAIGYTTITTTGTQTEDNCYAISPDKNGHVFLECGSTSGDTTVSLFAFSEATGIIKASSLGTICCNAANSQYMQLMPVFGGSSVNNSTIFKDHTVNFKKMSYLSATSSINQTGLFDPCNSNLGIRATYDSNGYIWYTCQSTDKIGAFNPDTMISKVLSPDLSNGVGTDCVVPELAYADYVNATTILVIANCFTTAKVESFKVTINPTTGDFTWSNAEPLSTVALTIGTSTSQRALVDTNHNRIVYMTAASGLTTYKYTDNGIIGSVENSGIGDANSINCMTDSYIAVSSADFSTFWCTSTNSIEGFISNSTYFAQSANIGDTTSSSDGRLGTYIGTTFYASQGSTNAASQKYIRLTDIQTIFPIPTSPNPTTTPVENNTNTGGIDCTDPAYSYRLICNIGGTGSLAGTSTLLNQSGTNIICQVGILHCTQVGNVFTPDNPDMKTNGVGYLLTMVLMGVMVGMLWVASRGDLTNIPTFVWFISTIGILGGATAMQWIDPTFLVIGIIAIVALAVAKTKGLLGGQTMFAGESG